MNTLLDAEQTINNKYVGLHPKIPPSIYLMLLQIHVRGIMYADCKFNFTYLLVIFSILINDDILKVRMLHLNDENNEEY